MLLTFFILWHGISFSEAAELCHPEDRAALTAFKHSFSNPDPFPTWKPIFDCCDWYGVTCDETTSHVTGLDIAPYQDLNGTIPSALSTPESPTSQNPQSRGPNPSIYHKTLTLTILGHKLDQHLRPRAPFLSSSQQSCVPRSFLQQFIRFNPPFLDNSSIDLSRNQLTGPIPELFTRTTEFPALDLSHNKLSGQIPPSFSRINFSSVDISRNGLSGDASVLFGEGKITSSIVISRNDFEFDFSKVVFMKTLDVLDVSHNRIYGMIPEQITDAVYLQFLNVSYNRLCGEIPSGWKLRYNKDGWDNSSFLHNKCLCGIPLHSCK